MGQTSTRPFEGAAVRWARAISIAALCALLSVAPRPARADDTPAPAVLQGPPTLLRPLRENVPFEIPEPTDPEVFSGYAAAPTFKVVPRIDQLLFYPCMNCHAKKKPNPEPRKLVLTPHPAALKHGKGRFWCLTCHQLKDRNQLHTLAGDPVSFDDAYLVCGQCHFNRQKDWYYGGHGKRQANWRGERVIYDCTFCHDPHDPTIKPRAPSPPPPVRVGLRRMAPIHTAQAAGGHP
jgi:hypothetical protein